METPPSQPDKSAIGRYEIRGEVARGRMGIVSRAVDMYLARDVAVKTIGQQLAHDPVAVRRFVHEARITAQLRHPGIPPVHDIGALPDGRPFMILAMIDGRTLEVALKGLSNSADRRVFLTTFEHICQTIAYAHSRGVVHRDLEAANIMISCFGEIEVLDWGLSVVIPTENGTSVAAEEVRVGAELGSPGYMAPEQARAEMVDCRSDVFGLGALLCHVLTGRPAFTGTDDDSVRRKAAAGDTRDAIARIEACGADTGLVSIAKQCLQVRRTDRPTNAGEVASLVAAWRENVSQEKRREADAGH